jgi:hypothetical protein
MVGAGVTLYLIDYFPDHPAATRLDQIKLYQD